MKKLLFALPLVAGASWAGTTMYSGNQTQKGYDDLVAQLDQLSTFAVVSESYNAGFINSTAITKVMSSSSPDAKVLFRLQHAIDHSPIGFDDSGARIGASTIVTTLVTDDMSEEARDFLGRFDTGEVFVLNSQLGLSGTSSNEFVLNKLLIKEDGDRLDFQGGNYQFDYDSNGKLTGQGQTGSLNVSTADAVELVVSASTATYDLDWVSKGVYTGTQEYKIPSITVSQPDAGIDVSLNDVLMDSETRIEDGKIASEASFNVADLKSPLPLNAAKIGFEMDGFALAGLQSYLQMTSSLMTSSIDEDADPTVLMEQLTDAYKKLFNPGTSLGYSVSLSNDGGDMDGNVKATFIGDGSTSGSDHMATLGDLLRAMTGELQFNADAAALEQTPAAMFLNDPSVGAYVQNDGEKYRSTIKVADLVVDINGEPLSLELMFGDMLAMPLDLSFLAQ